MKCTDVMAQLPLLVSQDSELVGEAEIRAHLADCAGCQHERQELEQLGKLLDANPEPQVAVDLASLYQRAAMLEARKSRRWRWVGMAASLLMLLSGGWALWGRLEIRAGGNEFVLRWGAPAVPEVARRDGTELPKPGRALPDRRDEQIEVLGAMVRAMVEELQTVELRRQRDRTDLDIRVSGLQDQTLKRWLALQKDMEALYVLTQKGE